LPTADELIEAESGVWAPLVLHISWEAADSFRSLERTARHISKYVVPWDAFIGAVDRSATANSAPTPSRRDLDPLNNLVER
jgi:hypothetical protein